MEITRNLSSKFLRDLEFATRLTLIIFVGTIAGFKTGIEERLPLVWLIPLIGLLGVADTVGGTLAQSILIAKNILPSSVFIYIMQLLGVGYKSYTAIILLFFTQAFLIGYLNPAGGPRKLALLFPIIIWTTLFATPSDALPSNFIWDTVALTAFGIGLNVGISLIVFPRFALFELYER
jgi:hypothetical protein